MLHSLIEYAENHGIRGESGFSSKRIRWFLTFTSDGKYLGLIEQTESQSTKPGIGRHFEKVPHLKFSGDTPMRQFLVDTTQYAVLFGVVNVDEKLLVKHRYFLDLLKKAGCVEPFLEKVSIALTDVKIREKINNDLLKQSPKAKPSDNLTFVEIKNDCLRIIVNENTWHEWWRSYFPTLFKLEKTLMHMCCLASGELCIPARTHPKIKGIGRDIGGKEETTLIGFNLDSFCSFGLEQSSNAAISQNLSEQYAAALNELISHHSYHLSGSIIIHWYACNEQISNEMDPLSWLYDMTDDKAHELDAQVRAQSLLNSIRSSKRADLLQYRYYSMILSGSSARVMIRDWIEGQFGELAESIVNWFEVLQITNISGKHLANSPKIEKVITSLLPPIKQGQKYTDWIKPISDERTSLWHAAISQKIIIPYKVISRIVTLHRAFMLSGDFESAIDERSQNKSKYQLRLLLYARMGLLKAYHLRKGDTHMKPYLNEEHPNPAYHCGRLMAVLAEIQRAALGNKVGAGVVQRYYAAASATPALVLGRLIRTSNYHLDKIAYQKKRIGLMDMITGIWCPLKDDIPKILTLEDQSYFALGYYQQLAKLATIDWANYEHLFNKNLDQEGE